MSYIADKKCGTRRRASAYVAVVSVSMLIALIGASALLAARVRRRSAQQSNDVLQARLLARSAIELGLDRIVDNYENNISTPEDTWVSAGRLNGGTLSWKCMRDSDTDALLAGRVYGKGEVGEAVRIYSTKLEMKEPENLVENSGAEYGSTPWKGIHGAAVRATSDTVHSGNSALLVTDRYNWYSGGGQDLMGKIEKGQTYVIEAWIKAVNYSSWARICTYVKGSYSGGDYDTPYYGTTLSPTEWNKITFTWTASWSGDLLEAWWKVETSRYGVVADFVIDDATMYPIDAGPRIEQVPDSWRREVVE